ncbi:Topoisomerase 1-associated factor 1 [Entomortierella beljakovae]|nr:Topoisomerase 1-associated factor 1 [Entomortierella beljakovae]
MDPDTESLLVSTCLALGGYEDISDDMNDDRQVYVMGDECLGCLKDIKKFIKYYDEPGDNVALNFLGKMGILEKDLIPIMLLNSPPSNPVKERLVLACIEVIVPMTWIIDNKELQRLTIMEEDDSIVGNLHERLEVLRGYKRAFLKPGVLQTVFDVLLRPLEVEYRMRTVRDQAIIRLGLYLFRNLVAIPDPDSSVSGTMDQFISSIVQEELLVRFQEETSSAMEPQLAEFNTMALEIFYYIFLGVDADELIPRVVGNTKNLQLQELLMKEEREKNQVSTAGKKRHDRFGTTGEIRLQDGTRMVLHKKGALFTSFESQLDEIKRPRARAKRLKETDDYKKTVSRSGLSVLRTLGLTLIESCFNPLFLSIRGDIEKGRDKIKSYHRSQYHCLMSFLLRFQRQYIDYVNKEYSEQRKSVSPSQLTQLEEAYQKNVQQCDFDLITNAIEVPSVYQIVRYIRELNEPKISERNWDEIRKAIACFQELVMTLHVMFKSPNEDYRDASDIVQNNLYYESGTLDVFLELSKRYSRQSTLYLHTLIESIHTLLKTLETYSKSKSFMFTLKRTRAAKKKREAAHKAKENQRSVSEGVTDNNETEGDAQTNNSQQEGDGGANSQDAAQEPEKTNEDDEKDESALTMRDHQFIFKDYERRFASEHVIDTYCTFLEDYANLDETQLHWAASLFYRIAVNAGNIAVFYKLSTLQLFHRILQSGREETKKDMTPFMLYVSHQFFKKMQEYPLLVVDALFPRTSRNCLEINIGRDEIEKEQVFITQKKEKRLMATELEIDPNQSEVEQIKIAVTALIYEDQLEVVEWTIETLKDAVAKRQLMTFHSEAELAENPDLMFSVENVQDIPIVPNNPARKHAIRTLPRLRLLFKLLQFAREDSDDEIKFNIPRGIPTDTLSENQDIIASILSEDPSNFNHYNYEELITVKKKTKSSGKTREGGGGGGRQRKEDTRSFHTAEFIIDSEDEDEEGYFEFERRLRMRIDNAHTDAEKDHLRVELENAKKKGKALKEMLAKKSGSQTANEGDEGAMMTPEAAKRPPLPDIVSDFDSDSDDENVRNPFPKSTSDVEDSDENDSDEKSPSNLSPHQRFSNQRKTIRLDDSSGDEDEDDEDSTQPLTFTQRMAFQSNKRRIILEDSDEDEDTGEIDDQEPNNGPAKKKFAFDE